VAPATERARTAKTPLFRWRESLCASELSATRRLVALVLSMHMNAVGGSCFPGIATIARETGLGRRTVIRALQDLQTSGYLTVVERGGTARSGKPKSNSYQARVPSTGATQTPVSLGHRSTSDTLLVSQTTPTGAVTTPEVVKRSSIEDERTQAPKPNANGEQVSGWGTTTNAEGLKRLEQQLAEVGHSMEDE
jgi:DNA-binding transcriptional MocR family regulator